MIAYSNILQYPVLYFPSHSAHSAHTHNSLSLLLASCFAVPPLGPAAFPHPPRLSPRRHRLFVDGQPRRGQAGPSRCRRHSSRTCVRY